MTDSVQPDPTPAATAATTRSRSPRTGCRECGWPFGPDLCLLPAQGCLLVVCRDPWACWLRQVSVDEHLGQITGQ